jgi:hypothetical protein
MAICVPMRTANAKRASRRRTTAKREPSASPSAAGQRQRAQPDNSALIAAPAASPRRDAQGQADQPRQKLDQTTARRPVP